MLNEADFVGLVHTFADELQQNFASLTSAQPEDQLKRVVQNLLHDLWPDSVVTRTEAQVEEVRGRPDIAVDVRGLLTGFIELKAPGLGSNPRRFRDPHSRQQWQRFRHLPNLIYTDGNDWSLFRYGELVEEVRADGDATSVGSSAFTREKARSLGLLLLKFLQWSPIVPSTPRSLAELLAPVTRIIRDDVHSALEDETSGIASIAHDWRSLLFPTADDAQFADAYAQTLTYSLLLARFHGATDLDPELAARTLDSGHGLLADALRVLANAQVRDEVGVGLDLLLRIVKAIDPSALQSEGNDPWLYFYEHFLAEYDPRLRNNYGVYYTPPAVIGAQVRLVNQLLVQRLEKDLGLAHEDVVILDPAAGTGAYPLAIIQVALDIASSRYGEGVRSQYATRLAENVHAFEILVGPYAVAHLRLTQKLLEEGGSLPQSGAKVFLTDTLESPNLRDLEQAGFLYRRLAAEHASARRVKSKTNVLVSIGNPPYDRQQRDEEDLERGVEVLGGWIRFGDQPEGQETETGISRETTGILKDFVDPARDAGRGADVKNLYNLYVYFWRWALWKVFETQDGPGIISFITAASYLRGPGFVGMREHMRRTFDELWIIDLEGDALGARRTENVFNIQSPVAIAIGVRYGEANPDTPARVWYSKIEGTREAKLSALDSVQTLEDISWRPCDDDWQAPFLPTCVSNYCHWPKLTDLFPWQHSGVQYKRSWPIGETRSVLDSRWRRLVSAPPSERGALFRQSRDRSVNSTYRDPLRPHRLPSIRSLPASEPTPTIERYAFRSLDRQWALVDGRLGDYLRPPLWQSHGPNQVYMTSLLTDVLGEGPAAMVAAHPPDLHHFRGSFGGKDVIPLYRDAAARVPNISPDVLERVGEIIGEGVSAEDLFAYCYAILSDPTYVQRFWDELSVPGPRIPITTNPALFRRLSSVGCRLVGWHTYGERMGESAPNGKARNTATVPTSTDGYPESFHYDPETCQLHVGDGIFAPVSPEVWSYAPSGMPVIHSWLGYRMRRPAGRHSSQLDAIRPTSWTADMTVELLELIWTIEATVAAWPELTCLLDEVLASPLISTASLPEVDDALRDYPRIDVIQDGLF